MFSWPRSRAAADPKKVTTPRAISASFLRTSSRTIEPEKGGFLMENTAVLLVQCPDRKGLDATIAEFIYRYDGNILHFKHHQAGEDRYFLARFKWDLVVFRLDMKDFDGAF